MSKQQYFDPNTLPGNNNETVLKPKIFKPLMNIKTGNFFSYSYGTAERGQSPNAGDNMRWVTEAPTEMQDKIDKVRGVHRIITGMYTQLKKISKKGTAYQKEEMQDKIAEQFEIINEIIYPKSEHEYVESKEGRRFRLEQQGELKLDAESIAALTAGAPVAGSTADASITQAKLEVAEQRIADMEAQDNTALVEAQATIKRLEANAKRRKPTTPQTE